jgi:vacuolar-type H+-ATPase subunit I/STV1
MIAAMKKVSVVTLKSQQDETLHALRDLGLLLFSAHPG